MTGLLNMVGDRLVENSRRWFPDLHADDWGATVHFALGLAGEIGELTELAYPQDEPDEIADVATYAFDLGRSIGCDLDAAYDNLPDHVGNSPADVVIAAGLAINLIKKVNRSSIAIDDARPQIATHLAAVIAICRNMAGDLLGAIDDKQFVCEQRWGADRPGQHRAITELCDGSAECDALEHIHGCFADEPCHHEGRSA